MTSNRVKEGDGLTVPEGMKSTEILTELEKQSEQVLPGIPNHVTFHSIFPRVSWREFYKLSLVSNAWKRAIQSHQVYEARVRSEFSETLVIVNHIRCVFFMVEDSQNTTLYSMREKTLWQLPPIPDLPRGLLKCECISLAGKVYVLGGAEELVADEEQDDGYGFCESASSAVFMLDIAGARKWKRCASMREPRLGFGCGVLNGKIYVFGGTSCYKPCKGSEVYDAEVDAWFPLKPIPSLRRLHRVSTVGDELFVHGGSFELKSVSCSAIAPALFLEVYSPGTDEWRRIEPFRTTGTEGVFLARGKLHLLDEDAIYVLCLDTNSRTRLQSCSFADLIGPTATFAEAPVVVAAMDDALLVGLVWNYNGGLFSCLFHGKGFGSQGKDIVWEPVHDPHAGYDRDFFIMSPLQL